MSRGEPAWQAPIEEILGGAVTPEELTALSLTLGGLRADLERRHLELPAGMAVSDRMVLLVRALSVFALNAALGLAAAAVSGAAAATWRSPEARQSR